jgi:hypothetical protein
MARDGFLQGMVYISLATIAEVPPAVSLLKIDGPLLPVYLRVFYIDLSCFEFGRSDPCFPTTGHDEK